MKKRSVYSAKKTENEAIKQRWCKSIFVRKREKETSIAVTECKKGAISVRASSKTNLYTKRKIQYK